MNSVKELCALTKLRLADISDVPNIMKLLNESKRETFKIKSRDDVVTLIETCILSVVQYNVNDELVGFIATKDYPLVPSIHPGAWEDFIWTKYKAIEMNSRNTLFIHLLCWDLDYSRAVVDKLLKSIFMHDPYLTYIAMTKMNYHYPLLVPGQGRAEASFKRIQAIERGVSSDHLPSLCVADRKEVSPRLRIRRAVEEDNDDLLPIIERHSKRLRELYGDYYISELISRHPESGRVLLVCEHKELAVGVMILNNQINFEELEEAYDLSPFAGLRHLNAPPHKPVNKKDMDFTTNFTPDILDTGSGIAGFENGAVAKDQQRVTWVFDDHEFSELNRAIAMDTVPTDLSTLTNEFQNVVMLNLLDEEEEMEYDIVNIDPLLFKMPDLLVPSNNISQNMLEGRFHPVMDKEWVDEVKANVKEDKTKKEKKKPRMSLGMIATSAVPESIVRYEGEPNAFLLELFAMHPNYDERYGFDMLEVAFELFPQKEYCVLCMPSDHAPFPLLEHFTLVTPNGNRLKYINESLFVSHINSVRGKLKVRCGEENDLNKINDLLEHAPKRPALLQLFESTLVGQKIESFVVTSENQPIGMIIVRPLTDSVTVRTQYDLQAEPSRPASDGIILSCVMSPAFEPHGRWCLREIIRLSYYSTLFWICQPMARGDASTSRNMMSLVERMLPVRPRRAIPNITCNTDLDKIYKNMATPFALWTIERPMTMFPKIFVNNDIVVVGASRTGLAFLETLIMGPTAKYLSFTNITLVSEYGLPTVSECMKAAETCVPRHGRYTDYYLKSIPFYVYIDVIHDAMVKIDRQKKCIYLKGGGVKYYDQLVLTCGQQFQHPDYMKESLYLVQELNKAGKVCQRMLMDNPHYHPDRVPHKPQLPENVMLINSLYQANVSLRKLLLLMSLSRALLNPGNRIAVYADCIEAYSCIASLLELGVRPYEIAFIESFPPNDPAALRVNCFNDETIDERVQASMTTLGIRTIRGYRLSSWHEEDQRVIALRLMGNLHCFILPCYAVFFFGLKAIDLYAFKAINECGLVYDGGLVVGPTFDTNDPAVYGAGTCVQYSRRLHAHTHLHRYYNSEDVGEALAKLFIKKVDPFSVCGDDDVIGLPPYSSESLCGLFKTSSNVKSHKPVGTDRRWQAVMTFDSPIVQSATLPGPLYYLKVRKPGPEIPMGVQMQLPYQGHMLTTDKNSNYIRVHLNMLHCVESITCLSKTPFSTEIITQLYGKHEAFFDKLLVRYMLGQIDDLYVYFTKPWMSALYQETFDDLMYSINGQEISKVYNLVKSEYDICCPAASKMAPSQSSMLSRMRLSGDTSNEGKRFFSMIDTYVHKDTGIIPMPKLGEIPWECGQPEVVHDLCAGLWKICDGEKTVITHLQQYLHNNSVVNPHYAKPNAKKRQD